MNKTYFDEGVIRCFGAILKPVTEDGGDRSHYVVDVEGVEGPNRFGKGVPVAFVVGNAAYNPAFYPCIIVRRTDLSVAMENGGHGFAIEYRQPADHSQSVDIVRKQGTNEEETITGHNRMVVKEAPVPHNISYDVQLRARGDMAHADSSRIFSHLYKRMRPPGFSMAVEDTAGDQRTYTALVQSTSPQMDELELTDRDVGWTIGLMIHADLDLDDPVEVPTVYTAPVVNTDRVREET